MSESVPRRESVARTMQALKEQDANAERPPRAKATCASCSVRKACLDYAVRIREPHGIWGGLNELERRGLISK